MNNLDISDGINEVKELSKKLRHSLHLYKEATRDPEATISLPNIDSMCQLADTLCEKMDKLAD